MMTRTKEVVMRYIDGELGLIDRIRVRFLLLTSERTRKEYHSWRDLSARVRASFGHTDANVLRSMTAEVSRVKVREGRGAGREVRAPPYSPDDWR